MIYFGMHGLKISSLSICVCFDPYTTGKLVGRCAWIRTLSPTHIPLKCNILLFILFLNIGTLGHFLQAEISDDGLASYRTSMKEENLMSGHV